MAPFLIARNTSLLSVSSWSTDQADKRSFEISLNKFHCGWSGCTIVTRVKPQSSSLSEVGGVILFVAHPIEVSNYQNLFPSRLISPGALIVHSILTFSAKWVSFKVTNSQRSRASTTKLLPLSENCFRIRSSHHKSTEGIYWLCVSTVDTVSRWTALALKHVNR